MPCGESLGSRWANEAEARDIVAYLIETYPAGTRDHGGLDLKLQTFRVNSATLIVDLIEENAALGRQARQLRQLREVFQGLKDMGNFPDRPVDRLMQELEYESETDEEYLATVDGFLSATGDQESFDNTYFPITEHAFVRMQPILQDHVRQRAAERAALDTWDDKVSTITRVSGADYDKWRASLKEPEIKASDEYTIVKDGDECRYVHPVTGEQAFEQFPFRNCYISSVKHGWAIASRYDGGNAAVHFLDGEISDFSIEGVGTFSQGLLNLDLYTSSCNYLTEEGRRAFDWRVLSFDYQPVGCGPFGPDAAPFADILFGFPKQCGYINAKGAIVIGPFEFGPYICNDFDHKTGLAELEHLSDKKIYTIDGKGERVSSR